MSSSEPRFVKPMGQVVDVDCFVVAVVFVVVVVSLRQYPAWGAYCEPGGQPRKLDWQDRHSRR
jgi:hypothetical protein